MEAISITLALVAVFASFAFVAGIVMLFVKKWRPKGKRIALISFVIMLAAPFAGMSLDGIADKQQLEARQVKLDEQAREEGFTDHADKERVEQELLDQKARDAGYKDHDAQLLAERQAKAKQAEEARIKALNGFPDKQTQASAKALGISRYTAYKLLEDKNTISRYCDYNTQSYVIEKAKQAEMDATSDDARQTEIWNRFEEKQQELLANYNTELSLIDFELNDLSIAGHWLFYCRAAEQNWSVVTEAQAKAATRSDAKEAKEALNAFYLLNLNEETSPFFSKQRYSTVSCEWENHNDMHFVGCQLISFSFKSNWQMFVVGRLSNGNLAVSPINGDTSSKLDITQARFYDETNGKHIFIQAYYQSRAYLARYAGTRIDIKAVRGLFE